MADGSQENKPKVVKTDAEWKAQLSPLQYNVARKAGTERAFSDNGHDRKEKGTYRCICCQTPLYHSDAKYNSGTGWPSFFAPIDKDAVAFREDRGLFSVRTEVICSTCHAHLGHVFEDGPRPTGLRFCMNGAAMQFEKEEE
ncbi:MAG: peptide-methionine (R)-S-oxide reductase MsrB [Pseudomonadota bacterium]|jgi:peptide-methionine (R)-S-oxide reductase|nr:peptide-methionine (R)-S-oxide reductase [Alphaproteobacteria bacterium]